MRALSLLQLAAMVVWWSVEVVMKEEEPAQPPVWPNAPSGVMSIPAPYRMGFG